MSFYKSMLCIDVRAWRQRGRRQSGDLAEVPFCRRTPGGRRRTARGEEVPRLVAGLPVGLRHIAERVEEVAVAAAATAPRRRRRQQSGSEIRSAGWVSDNSI